MTITLLIIISIYSLLMISLIIGFDIVPEFKAQKTTAENKFSILIPFRNEAENLEELLISLKKIDYPSNSHEIILVDDESTDNSNQFIIQFIERHQLENFQVISNERKSKSPKKDAIETAIRIAKNDWIITTDADCEVPVEWLNNFNAYIEMHNPKMICGPVTYKTNNSLFQNYQLLDFISLIATTIGSFGIKKAFMCNGANLCYSKKCFIEVNGYAENNLIASGDDVFLMEKFKLKYKHQIHFLKATEAIVTTKPVKTFRALINQRIRWGSKTAKTQSGFAKLVGVTVLLINSCIIITPILYLTTAIQLSLFLFIILSKFLLDLILLNKVLTFTNQITKLIFYPFSAIIHPLLTCYFGIYSILNKRTSWKS